MLFSKQTARKRGGRGRNAPARLKINGWWTNFIWFTQTALGREVYVKWAHMCSGTHVWLCFCRCACARLSQSIQVSVYVYLCVWTACKHYLVVSVSVNSRERGREPDSLIIVFAGLCTGLLATMAKTFERHLLPYIDFVKNKQRRTLIKCVSGFLSTCMVLLLVRVMTKFFHSQCCSTTWAKMTCPFPQAPASWVPSADQAKLNTLPVLGFSNA